MERETAFHLAAGLFIWLLGLCVGSFLNVVIYRLPRGLSVSKPRRSFCPSCEKQIEWYDNVPVLSWVLLRGRCRRCQRAISVQYPLIEAVTGLTFVLIYHLLAVSHNRVGMEIVSPADAPVLAAWLVLAAAMIACSAMDLTAYIIDVRVTDVCMVAGILLYALWPGAETLRDTASSPMAAAAVAAFVASGVMLYLNVWRSSAAEVEADPEEATEGSEKSESRRGVSTMATCIPLAIFAGLAVWVIGVPALGDWAADGVRLTAATALMAIFIAIVIAGGQHRAADQEINDAIEEESPHARRLAFKELLWLTPPILAGAAAYLLLSYMPNARSGWTAAVAWKAGALQPLAGASYAVLGAMVGAAGGWVLRIVFTLAFGREAFGTGDIYILAAAGAAAGWDIVLLGLGLSVALALGGWIIQLLLKSNGMIPFGPWLGLGFIAALWLNRPLADIASDYREAILSIWERDPRALLVVIGILLVVAAVAMVIARLTRIWLESRFESKAD